MIQRSTDWNRNYNIWNIGSARTILRLSFVCGICLGILTESIRLHSNHPRSHCVTTACPYILLLESEECARVNPCAQRSGCEWRVLFAMCQDTWFKEETMDDICVSARICHPNGLTEWTPHRTAPQAVDWHRAWHRGYCRMSEKELHHLCVPLCGCMKYTKKKFCCVGFCVRYLYPSPRRGA